MSEQPKSEMPSGVAGLLVRISILAGSAALLGAMGVEALAVLGRHTGRPFVGSIELVQACVVVATSSAIVGATVLKAHATVHILIERLGVQARTWLGRFADLLSAAVFAAFAGGSIWISAELWFGDERTPLLHVPLAVLRAFWCACALLTALLFLISALARHPRPPGEGHADGA